jgi:hypothetical protein
MQLVPTFNVKTPKHVPFARTDGTTRKQPAALVSNRCSNDVIILQARMCQATETLLALSPGYHPPHPYLHAPALLGTINQTLLIPTTRVR